MTNPILAQEVMLLAQKLDKAVPKTDKELKDLLDSIYATTKEAIESDELPKFKGIVEIATSKPVILSAIEKLKRNKGSNTPVLMMKSYVIISFTNPSLKYRKESSKLSIIIVLIWLNVFILKNKENLNLDH